MAYYLKNRNADSVFLSPITEQEIEFIIQSLNSQKAIGACSIPAFLLKTLTKHIAKPLSAIVNLPFKVGVFPDDLKVAKVNSFHEKDSCDNPSNYRPISILLVF